MDGVSRATLRARARGIGVGVFAAPPAAMGAALDRLEAAEVLHFDLMDGVFVPQFTAGPAFVAACRGRGFLDVHLMVADPLAQIAACAEAGADLISVHAEAPNAALALARIRSESARLGRPILAGLAGMPGTALAGLSGLATAFPAQLSGGQRQRLALVRALARQPKLLLLDEPLSALDPDTRARLQDQLRRLHDLFGATTLMTSHDPAEARRLADRVLRLEAGRLGAAPPPPPSLRLVRV